MRRAFAVAEQEVNVYLAHVAALFVPGVRVRSLPVHPGKVGTLSEWSEAELVLLVEEGRRQLDRQRADLDRVQARSQLLFTTAAALLVVLTAEFETMASRGGMVFMAWYLGLALVALGLLGSAALMSLRSWLVRTPRSWRWGRTRSRPD